MMNLHDPQDGTADYNDRPRKKVKKAKGSLADLRRAAKKAKRKRHDDTEVGTVVRWTASDKYTYAAIKTPVGWFTTARAGNPFVKQVIAFEDLLEIVADPETSEVLVAAEWQAVE